MYAASYNYPAIGKSLEEIYNHDINAVNTGICWFTLHKGETVYVKGGDNSTHTFKYCIAKA